MENPPGASKRKCTEYFKPIIIKRERRSSTDEQCDINVNEKSETSINSITQDVKREPTETESPSTEDLPPPEEAKSSTVCWTTQSDSMRDIKFKGERKVLVPIPSDPYETFRLILTDEFLDLIVRETNINARKMKDKPSAPKSRIKAYTDLTRDELITFLGLILHMGTIRQNRMTDYWKTHWLFNTPCFTKLMPRNRFMIILRCLPSGDMKWRDFVNYFNERMKNLYSPGRDLIIDEGMVLWKGKPYFREDTKTKPLRGGHRLRVLADTEGVVMKIHINGNRKKLVATPIEKVIFHLLEGKLDLGHCVYMGDRFNSYELAVQLLDRDTHCTGTLSRNSKDLPQEMKTAVLDHCDSISLFANGVHVCKWKQRLPQYCISTEYGGLLDGFNTSREQRKVDSVNTTRSEFAVQPSAVTKYKETMSTVELQDLMVSFYPLNQDKTRWEKKLFLHIMQMSLNNAFLLHTMNKPAVRSISGAAAAFYQFRVKVLERMLPKPPDFPPMERMRVKHVLTKVDNYKIREKKFKDKPSRLVRESVRKDCRRCRLVEKKSKGSLYECRGCEGAPGYCVECFCLMHL